MSWHFCESAEREQRLPDGTCRVVDEDSLPRLHDRRRISDAASAAATPLGTRVTWSARKVR